MKTRACYARCTVLIVACCLVLLPCSSLWGKQKVILDTDMGELNDDAYALFMLANSPEVELLGVTVCPGNTWQEEGLAYSLRHLEMIGRGKVPVLRGVDEPIMGLRGSRLDAEEKLFGKVMYLGAYARPRPASFRKLQRAPYGGYAKSKPARGDAVDFIVRQVKKHPHQLTLLMIGPTTNLALAVRKHPEIVPLVQRVIYMGGAIDVPGNTSPAAEFNWWFDPEAARITLRTPFVEQIVVPLDICEKVFYTRAIYQRIAAAEETPIVKMFQDLQGPDFAKNPQQTSFVWDSLAAAIFLKPQLATKMEELYADVDATYGPNYGKSFGYRACDRRDLRRPGDFPDGTQKVKVLRDIDRHGFWDLFVGLMTAKESRRPAQK